MTLKEEIKEIFKGHIEDCELNQILALLKAEKNRLIGNLIEDLIRLPTGMFDSTPYKKELITKLKNDMKKELGI